MPRSPDRHYDRDRRDRRDRSPRSRYDAARHHEERSPPRHRAERRGSPPRYRRDSRSPPRYDYHHRSVSRSPEMDSPVRRPTSELPPPPLNDPYQLNDHYQTQISNSKPTPFDPKASFEFQQATRWSCKICGFTNYGPDQCGSCGTPRPPPEAGLLSAPSIAEAPNQRRFVVTNELCFSRMPINITQKDLFDGIEAILRDFPTINLSEALRGMKIELSSGEKEKFPSSLAIVSFRDIDPAARIFETVKSAGQRFLGAKMRVEFSRRSILRLQREREAAESGKPLTASGESPVPEAIPAPTAEEEESAPFVAPVWKSLEELRETLSDIDTNWSSCSEAMKTFYNEHLPLLNQTIPAPELASAPIPAPPPPPAPAPAPPPSETVTPASKTLSFAERIALAKQKASAEAAAAAAPHSAAVVVSSEPTAPHSPTSTGEPLSLSPTPQRRVLQVVALGNWPRFGFVAANNVTGKAVVRAANISAAVYPSHVSSDPIVISVPLAAVEHATNWFSKIAAADENAERESLLGYSGYPYD